MKDVAKIRSIHHILRCWYSRVYQIENRILIVDKTLGGNCLKLKKEKDVIK
jgi:hypothetical protein